MGAGRISYGNSGCPICKRKFSRIESVVKSMIDTEKWAKASDETKLQAIQIIKAVMNENAVTKADNAIITDFLLKKVEISKQ